MENIDNIFIQNGFNINKSQSVLKEFEAFQLICEEITEESNPFINKMCFAIKHQGKYLTNNSLGEFSKNLLSYQVFSNKWIPQSNKLTNVTEKNAGVYYFKNEIHNDPESECNSLFNEFFDSIYKTKEYDPYSLCDLTYNTDIVSFKFTNISEKDDTVLLPLNFVNNMFGNKGIGIGDSLTTAKIDALYDAIAHYVRLQTIVNRISLPDITLDVMQDLPELQNFFSDYDSHETNIKFYDASLDGKFPVVCCAIFGFDKYGNSAFNIDFSADLEFEKAIAKAFCKTAQKIAVDKHNFGYRAVYESEKILNEKNIRNIILNDKGFMPIEIFNDPINTKNQSIDANISDDEKLGYLIDLVEGLGKKIYFQLCNEKCNVIRIVIPEFSEIIDPTTFEENNSNMGLMYADFFANLEKQSDDDIAEFLDSIKENEIPDETKVQELLHFELDNEHRDEEFEELTIGELKALIAVKQQDWDACQYWCGWVQEHCANNKHTDIDFFSCLSDFIHIATSEECSEENIIAAENRGNLEDGPFDPLESYITGLCTVYGEDTVDDVIDHVNNEKLYRNYGTVLEEIQIARAFENQSRLLIAVREFNNQ